MSRKNGSNPLLKVRRSSIQGRGVFAMKRIRKGQQIIEYVGELISEAEETKRYNEARMKRHHTFLFEVDDNLSIDGAVGGNESIYVNHSCDPNCESVNIEDRIYVEALKNIQPGVELTYDYRFAAEEPISQKEKNFYTCHCGTRKCRGTILLIKRKRKRRKKTRR